MHHHELNAQFRTGLPDFVEFTCFVCISNHFVTIGDYSLVVQKSSFWKLCFANWSEKSKRNVLCLHSVQVKSEGVMLMNQCFLFAYIMNYCEQAYFERSVFSRVLSLSCPLNAANSFQLFDLYVLRHCCKN